MNIGYYPGCALHGSSNDYEQSVRACLGALGVNLCELDDWICCGATAAHSLNHKLAVALPARSLAIAERDGYDDLLAPCPMCSAQLIKARTALARDRALREEIAATVELPLEGRTEVLNLIQIFQRIGLERLKSRATRSLNEFKPACYYGCLLVRPPQALRFDDCEHPTSMETLLSELGAAPVEWNFKTECCGAGLTMCNERTVLDLSHKIISNAAAHGANCIVVACPMCHVNLDMKQADIERHYGIRHAMKVYYLSDLVGMALGLHENELGVNRHFVSTP
ncbi:MAG TPA: CoB--CoM heterodisulfide reductase iron-sulfur subunit B family protein [Phycisphaerae bacterium]|jgi:heterodisulfide reductase subunit B|nr:heterodisulfide reductase subunit B [Phycisphaerae bacterium]HOB74610.1 CoB--CoM heterodisulfide reductase iron-sulfur subunit B family protein [Phycisphaerae bacterium]HOJ53565.1 CoB--CoM heterodisulfide reductase iron-sulfur subunit B family protein [Phycisphaerae bacterium]HOL25278.1 CoB--CoM heterodisulfide reductase iron-sulfur subunit B family protein [Phycisphaerae bacterium]HPP20507.1 CoB--CoM heterodisulfide reductase iron-sulfur subunit B family protein [Phycisphaerae bacterium]